MTIRRLLLGLARKAYQAMPLPISAKRRAKDAFLLRFPRARLLLFAQSSATTHAKRPAYRELLVASLFSPYLTAPYDDKSAYFIAFMDSFRKQLERRYRERPHSKLISIVMPTYNRAHCIGDAIRSVLSQTYTNWELFVIDDCGDDGTEDLVASFGDVRIKYTRLTENRGSAGARNAGLELATGDFVCYLDSDNTIEASFLLILANQLAERPELEMVYCAQRIYHMANRRRRETQVRFAPFHRPSLENRNYIDAGVLMHRRSAVEPSDAFDERLRFLEDWDFLLRHTAEKTPRAVPAILSNYYVGKSKDQISASPNERRQQALASIDQRIRSAPLLQAIPNLEFDRAEQMYSLPYEVSGPAARRPVTIIIPNYEAEPYLRACVAAIQQFSGSFEVQLIIVDNGSSLPVTDYLRDLAEQGGATVLFNDRNLGFTFAVNQGLELARSDNDIVLMNNDAIATRGWLAALQSVLDDHPNAGLVVPSQIVLSGEKTLPIHQPYQDELRECDVSISLHHGNVVDPLLDASKGYIELSYAPFFCVYIPRAVVDILGPLDVENGPHYRSDCIYCDLVTNLCYRKIVYTPHAKVYHFVQRSTEELKGADPKLYRNMFVDNSWDAVSSSPPQQNTRRTVSLTCP